MDQMLASKDQELDVVLELTADREELATRLISRAMASGRNDDNEDAIRHRLDLYNDESEALVPEYARRGLLTKVDGSGAAGAVTDRIFHGM